MQVETIHSEKANLKTLNSLLSYLSNLKDSKESYDHQNFYIAINGLKDCTGSSWFKYKPEISQNYFDGYIDLFTNILVYLSMNMNEIDFRKCRENPTAIYADASQNERRIFILNDLIRILNNIFSLSIKYQIHFSEKARISPIFIMLDDLKFCKGSFQYDNGKMLYSLICYLSYTSNVCEHNKIDWLDLNAISILLNLAKTQEFLLLNVFIYKVVVNIADDKVIEDSNDLTESAIDLFVKFVEKIVEEVENKTQSLMKILRIQFIDDNNKDTKDDHNVHEVYGITTYSNEKFNLNISLTELLLALFKLSVNDKIKKNIFQKNNLKKSLTTIITNKYSDIEKQYALELLGQLCLDSFVIDQITKEKKFCSYLNQLNKDVKSLDKPRLKKILDQIEWLMEQHNNQILKPNETVTVSKKKIENEGKKEINKIGQIMISYNSASRELSLKIKSRLESEKFKVWMDVSDIYDSSLDAMAKAVENSEFVLMCISEKYRQSLYCQLEAKYAMRLNKKIIPLVMQKGSEKANGWLGIILSDRIFVDFTKYEFDEAFKRLGQQISLNGSIETSDVNIKQVSNNNDQSVQKTNEPSKEKTKIIDWDEKQVEKWLIDNKIDSSIIKAIGPCSGKLLHQLYLIKISTPEFFFKSLTKNDQCDLITVANFALLIENYFKNENISS